LVFENQVDDGKIFIYYVEGAIRLSTGVHGNEAIL
jgi:nitrogen regulatory protein PII